MKKILAIATLAAGALVAPAASLITPAAGAAGGAAPRATPKACTTKQLVTYLTGANGAAGTTYYTLNFTNLGGACTLHGYPGVSAVSHSGHILGSAARRQKVGRAKTVTLRAAKVGNPSSATVTLAVVQALNFPAARCHPVNAAGLRVYPPNQRTSETIPLPFTACSHRGPIYLKIGAVK